jgi:hypothetical protein
MIRFIEYFGDDPYEGMEALKDDFVNHYGKEPEALIDLAYYCADGWSRWNATERVENPSDEEVRSYLQNHAIDM